MYIFYSNFFNNKHEDWNIKESVQQEVHWFPIPALIPFALTIVLFGYVIPSINFKIGIPIDIVKVQEEVFLNKVPYTTSIWIGVKVIDKDVVIVTDDRKMFKWKYDEENPDLSSFVEYLKNKSNTKILHQALLHIDNAEAISVGIACDENTRFFHIRPILYALAQAGVSDYYFEVQQLGNKISDSTIMDNKHTKM